MLYEIHFALPNSKTIIKISKTAKNKNLKRLKKI